MQGQRGGARKTGWCRCEDSEEVVAIHVARVFRAALTQALSQREREKNCRCAAAIRPKRLIER